MDLDFIINMKTKKRKFTIHFPDPTAEGGLSKVMIDPTFDRMLSTGELVNTVDLAHQYCRELFNPPKINYEK